MFGYTANIYKAFTVFPLVDLRHLLSHPLSPVKNSNKQTHGTNVNLAVIH